MEGPSLKDKRYAGDNRLISPRAHIDWGGVWHSMSARHILGLENSSWAVRPLWHAGDWVRTCETVQSLSVVGVRNLSGSIFSTRDRDGLTSSVSVVPPEHCRVTTSGKDKR